MLSIWLEAFLSGSKNSTVSSSFVFCDFIHFCVFILYYHSIILYVVICLKFSFSLVTLKVSIHNIFEIRVLLNIFDIVFPYKCSFFKPLCLSAKWRPTS